MSPVMWLYGLPLVIIMFVYLRKQSKNTRQSKSVFEEAVASGMTEPASLHPVLQDTRQQPADRPQTSSSLAMTMRKESAFQPRRKRR